MTSTDYIISKLDSISSKINEIEFVYAYDEELDYHIIEVSPDSVYLNDLIFAQLEIDFKEEFKNLFPDDNLLISLKEDYHNMNNVRYTYPKCIETYKCEVEIFDLPKTEIWLNMDETFFVFNKNMVYHSIENVKPISFNSANIGKKSQYVVDENFNLAA